jgi:hypothetical protein
LMTYLAGLDFRARMMTPTVKQRVEQFVGYASERFDMIAEDLAALADGPLVLAEGPFLLPELVAPALASTGRAVWLLPTKDFTARTLGVRNEPQPTRDASERERAYRLRLERDAELTALMRRDAARLGLTVLEADGSLSLDETEQVLAAYFAPVIEDGLRMRDGRQRVAIRREENAVANAQLDSFLAYLGDTAPADLPAFPYACECSTLGCVVEVPMMPAAYRSVGRALGHD